VKTTIKDLKARIQASIERNDQAVIRALLLLYSNQTHEEQSAERTIFHNRVGFSGTDSEILSSFAKQAEDWASAPVGKRKYDFPLSSRQTAVARRLLKKYWRQLLPYAQAKLAQES